MLETYDNTREVCNSAMPDGQLQKTGAHTGSREKAARDTCGRPTGGALLQPLTPPPPAPRPPVQKGQNVLKVHIRRRKIFFSLWGGV